MANAEHFEILKLGGVKWNAWRAENPKIIPDLTGANLNRLELDGFNFRNAELSKTFFNSGSSIESDFSYAKLLEADFSFSMLAVSNFVGANLTNALLYYATMFDTKFAKANLTGADLGNARMDGSNFIKTNFSNADLHQSDLTGSNLKDANLSWANLENTFLVSTNLENTNLQGASLGKTTFGSTDLSLCLGLDSVKVARPCIIDFQTLRTSKNLPKSFLQKIGLPELYIDYLPKFFMDALTFYPAFLSHSSKNKDFARKLYEALICKVGTFFSHSQAFGSGLARMKYLFGLYEQYTAPMFGGAGKKKG